MGAHNGHHLMQFFTRNPNLTSIFDNSAIFPLLRDLSAINLDGGSTKQLYSIKGVSSRRYAYAFSVKTGPKESMKGSVRVHSQYHSKE